MKQILFFIIAIAFLLSSCRNSIKKESTLQLSANASLAQNMAEERFWHIIDNSIIESNNNYQVQVVSLKQILTKLNPAEIVAFNNTFYTLMGAAYDNKLWGAAYVIDNDCGEDNFKNFRGYLIAHGKEKFYQTLKNPESCVSWVKADEEENWEGILYAAPGAYTLITGKEIPDTGLPKYELKGESFDKENVEKQYPQLAKKFDD